MEAGERLLRCLEELSAGELRTFLFYLGPVLPRGKLEPPCPPVRVAELLLKYEPQRALELAAGALGKVPRRDLLPLLLLQRGEERPEERRREPPFGGGGEAPPAAPDFSGQTKRVSDSQLMKLARKMGKGWRQIGIEYLGIENSVLEQIEEENANNVVMRAYYMLRNWKNREKEGATAARLYFILHQEEVQLDSDAYAFLLESA
ncbi:uncharacterized protein LOC121924353 isoform X2 [Sceloporus undulatus]|uniref:uncharacterized protein LOC121924353 isoform X2 n=1 Tax=Sceloporus undulatus TaxID=8520 RepID=UPI001C4A9195|nr:uncharacterized protein LOC121924353 isoform X2 [Sceloporus undulatus]